MKLFVTAVALLWSLQAFCCTTFVLEKGQRVYLGRNLDWDWDDGMVMVNPRAIEKSAFVFFGKGVAWKSKYGSVTFNQFGNELPFGGMNEAGLVIENMWLDETKYPASDARPEINMLQWIQYQLDNHATVDEVVESDKKIRLENTPVRARIHYLVCDAKGNSATIEMLNGAITVHRGTNLQYRALANDPYESSAAILRTNAAPRDISKPLADKDSSTRFCRAAMRAKAFEPAKDSAADVKYAFDTLNQVDQGDYTVWKIVYDVTSRQIHIRTHKNSKDRRVDLKALDYSCKSPRMFADINANPSASGAIEFKPFSEEEHRKYVQRFFSQDSLKQTVGDLTPMIEPFLKTIGAYHCAE